MPYDFTFNDTIHLVSGSPEESVEVMHQATIYQRMLNFCLYQWCFTMFDRVVPTMAVTLVDRWRRRLLGKCVGDSRRSHRCCRSFHD